MYLADWKACDIALPRRWCVCYPFYFIWLYSFCIFYLSLIGIVNGNIDLDTNSLLEKVVRTLELLNLSSWKKKFRKKKHFSVKFKFRLAIDVDLDHSYKVFIFVILHKIITFIQLLVIYSTFIGYIGTYKLHSREVGEQNVLEYSYIYKQVNNCCV